MVLTKLKAHVRLADLTMAVCPLFPIFGLLMLAFLGLGRNYTERLQRFCIPAAVAAKDPQCQNLDSSMLEALRKAPGSES